MQQFINPKDLKERLDNNEDLFVLDVREPHEFENWHIPNSVNIPLNQLQISLQQIPKNKQVVTICLHGMRSDRATQFLAQQGYNATTMAGGMVAWNSVYDIVEIPIQNGTIIQFRRIGKGCLSYMIISNAEAIVIDATMDIKMYKEKSKEKNAKIIATIETHTHADHVSGCRELADQTSCLYYSPDEVNNVFQHESVIDNQEMKCGNVTIKAISTPGHTPESTMYLIDNYAITGDTLFVESVGRPDLGQNVEENAAILWDTLQNIILKLPENTKILPGHYSEKVEVKKFTPIMASLAELRQMVALNIGKDEFIAWIKNSMQPKPGNFERIKRINQGMEYPTDDEDIGDLEAGPNRCSVN